MPESPLGALFRKNDIPSVKKKQGSKKQATKHNFESALLSQGYLSLSNIQMKSGFFLRSRKR